MRTSPFSQPVILFEGIGAAGKTTLLSGITEQLAVRNLPAKRYKQPWFSEQPGPDEMFLRHVIYASDPLADIPDEMRVELQRAITRQRHRMYRDMLIPDLMFLETGVALLDRCWVSTCVYAEATAGVPQEEVARWHEAIPHFFTADLTVILDLPVDVALERSGKRGQRDIFEQEKDLQRRLREGFLRFAEAHATDNVVVLNADCDPETLLAATMPHIDVLLVAKAGRKE